MVAEGLALTRAAPIWKDRHHRRTAAPFPPSPARPSRQGAEVGGSLLDVGVTGTRAVTLRRCAWGRSRRMNA